MKIFNRNCSVLGMFAAAFIITGCGTKAVFGFNAADTRLSSTEGSDNAPGLPSLNDDDVDDVDVVDDDCKDHDHYKKVEIEPGEGNSCGHGKVLICHVPKGNPSALHTLCISVQGAQNGHRVATSASAAVIRKSKTAYSSTRGSSRGSSSAHSMDYLGACQDSLD